MLLFRIADEPWAIAATEVKDLIPLVTLQPYKGAYSPAEGALADNLAATKHIAGLLNYHGEYLPVIDVAQSVAQQPAPIALSTRIAIVEAPVEPGLNGNSWSKKLGLILDQADQTAYLSEAVDLPVNSPYLRATLKGPEGIVQQLAIASFFNAVAEPRSPLSGELAYAAGP